jgi:hypothetical protein
MAWMLNLLPAKAIDLTIMVVALMATHFISYGIAG